MSDLVRATVAREIPWVDPVRAFAPLAEQPGALLLDSSLVDGRVGRWSFVALRPFATMIARGGQAWLDDEPLEGDPFRALGAVLARYPQATEPTLPPFQGGVAGLWGYDLGRSIERLPSCARADTSFPDMVLGLYDVTAAFDLVARRAWIISTGFPEQDPASRQRRAIDRAAELDALLAQPNQAGPFDPRPSTTCAVRSNFTRAEYEDAVAQVIEYILAGDIFQANLSQRFEAELPADQSPFDVYSRLRELSPAPFAAYVNAGELVLASSSPERFLRVVQGAVETRPIKGTRSRGSTPEQDEQLGRELLGSAKERAENVMIVDLLRNDLSKVCRAHSVRVEALCALERYATVQHLVSTVVGRLAPGHGPVDLLRGCFPGGSISGAPKVRAMEIIDELEPTRRGPYCGAIGYLGFDGTMDTSIAIRTITFAGRRTLFQAGGAIVADSVPPAEYEETLAKARAMCEAVSGRDPARCIADDSADRQL